MRIEFYRWADFWAPSHPKSREEILSEILKAFWLGECDYIDGGTVTYLASASLKGIGTLVHADLARKPVTRRDALSMLARLGEVPECGIGLERYSPPHPNRRDLICFDLQPDDADPSLVESAFQCLAHAPMNAYSGPAKQFIDSVSVDAPSFKKWMDSHGYADNAGFVDLVAKGSLPGIFPGQEPPSIEERNLDIQKCAEGRWKDFPNNTQEDVARWIYGLGRFRDHRKEGWPLLTVERLRRIMSSPQGHDQRTKRQAKRRA